MGCPVMASGLMYCGVPHTMPVFVTAAPSPPSMSLAMPKSSTFTKSGFHSLFSIRMLSGFRSRWMMPCACASAIESQIWLTMATQRSAGRAPLSLMSLASDTPLTNSMAM